MLLDRRSLVAGPAGLDERATDDLGIAGYLHGSCCGRSMVHRRSPAGRPACDAAGRAVHQAVHPLAAHPEEVLHARPVHRADPEAAHELALDYLAGVDRRPVVPATDLEALRVALGGPLLEVGVDPVATVRALAAAADPGLVATAGPRYSASRIGGAQPAALAADWLTSAWDQNAAMYVMSPAAAVVEEVVEGWLLDVFGLLRGDVGGSQRAGPRRPQLHCSRPPAIASSPRWDGWSRTAACSSSRRSR